MTSPASGPFASCATRQVAPAPSGPEVGPETIRPPAAKAIDQQRPTRIRLGNFTRIVESALGLCPYIAERATDHF
jgi:hypothetical protein